MASVSPRPTSMPRFSSRAMGREMFSRVRFPVISQSREG